MRFSGLRKNLPVISRRSAEIITKAETPGETLVEPPQEVLWRGDSRYFATRMDIYQKRLITPSGNYSYICIQIL